LCEGRFLRGRRSQGGKVDPLKNLVARFFADDLAQFVVQALRCFAAVDEFDYSDVDRVILRKPTVAGQGEIAVVGVPFFLDEAERECADAISGRWLAGKALEFLGNHDILFDHVFGEAAFLQELAKSFLIHC